MLLLLLPPPRPSASAWAEAEAEARRDVLVLQGVGVNDDRQGLDLVAVDGAAAG